MKAQYRIITLFCLLLLSIYSRAGVLSGRITDEDGEPLSFASILIQGSNKGTSANAEGYFSMQLSAGEYTLIAQYIGYRQSTKTIRISENGQSKVNFELQVQGYELKDVVVRSDAEDPAYRIIRNAIKQRESHLRQQESFQANIYLKGVLRNRGLPDKLFGQTLDSTDKKAFSQALGVDSNGNGVIYLCEQVADFYQKGKKRQLVVLSVKESGNPNGIGLGNVPPVINFYENNVNILVSDGSGKQEFLSPIAQSALNAYKYKLEGEFEENGQRIFKIKLWPKRAFEKCFAGHIYIADADWAIHSLALDLNTRQGLDVLDTFKIDQQYKAISKDNWVIQHQVFYPCLRLFGLDFAGNFVSVYSEQKVNQTIPDSIFNKRIIINYQQNANKKDSAYWSQNRPLLLEEDELINYNFKDSVYQVEHSPEYLEKERKTNNKFGGQKVLLTGYSYQSKGQKNVISFSPLITDVNFNTVEGLVYAPGINIRHRLAPGKYLNADNQLRYGFSNTHFNAKTCLSYTDSQQNWKNRYWRLSIAGGRYVAPLNNLACITELFNTYATLFDRNNYLKLFERYFVGLKGERNWGNGWQLYLSAHYEKRSPLYNTTNYSWAGKKVSNTYTDNQPAELLAAPMQQHQLVIVEGRVEYQPGIRFAQYPDQKVPIGSKAPIFSLYYQKGMGLSAADQSDFDKWAFSISDHIGLKRWGDLEYHYSIGGFLNAHQVQIPDRYHLRGNLYSLAGRYLQSFQLAPYYRFSNTEKLYHTLFVEYAMKGILSNKLPLLRQAHWYFVLGSNSFYAQSGLYYTEAFAGIDNIGYKIFRGIRVDFLKGWDSYKNNYSGIRIGYKLGNSFDKLKESNKTNIF